MAVGLPRLLLTCEEKSDRASDLGRKKEEVKPLRLVAWASACAEGGREIAE